MEHPDFLEKKYPDLPGSKPVERAVEQAKKDPKREFAPHTRDERIQAYLDRLDRIVANEREWELLKNKIVKDFVIDLDDEETLFKIANGLYESEKKLILERGQGAHIGGLEQQVEEGGGVVEMYRDQVLEKRDIQEKTIRSWLDYLQVNDAHYPTWFRYFVVRNLQKMGTLDKEKGEYSKRTAYTVAAFPEINSESLGLVYRWLTVGIGNKEFVPKEGDTVDESKEKLRRRGELQKIIDKKDFVKLYTFAQIESAGALNRESLQGEWKKYSQNSDYAILEDALDGKGTGWCTATGSAQAHLNRGDFYVYFTKGKSGVFSEPRIAIRMEGNHVAEVRGVNHRQELEPALVDIATEKYHALPGGEKFDKKSQDMKRMTELSNKQDKKEQFTKDDLIFLYEINSPIEGFGYDRDPRITELIQTRDPKKDAPIIFDCNSSEIAWGEREVNKKTKIYIGRLFKNIFQKNFEHIYTSFSKEKLVKPIKYSIETLGMTGKQFKQEFDRRNILYKNHGSEAADYLLDKIQVSKKNKSVDLITLTVEDFGLGIESTTEEIYNRAREIGLELCPADIGPTLRLQNIEEGMIVAMKQINDQVFFLDKEWKGEEYIPRLRTFSGKPNKIWPPHYRFVFLLPRNKADKNQ